MLRNKYEITMDVLNGVQLVVFGAPRSMFSEAEFNCLRKYIDLGGSVLVMFTEGGEKELHTNINYLLEEFGIMVNSGKKIFKIIKTNILGKIFYPKCVFQQYTKMFCSLFVYLYKNVRLELNNEQK